MHFIVVYFNFSFNSTLKRRNNVLLKSSLMNIEKFVDGQRCRGLHKLEANMSLSVH